jgi:hypothetical protein
MLPEHYLNSPHPTCESCGVPKPDVRSRPDPFVTERIVTGPRTWKARDECQQTRAQET